MVSRPGVTFSSSPGTWRKVSNCRSFDHASNMPKANDARSLSLVVPLVGRRDDRRRLVLRDVYMLRVNLSLGKQCKVQEIHAASKVLPPWRVGMMLSVTANLEWHEAIYLAPR